MKPQWNPQDKILFNVSLAFIWRLQPHSVIGIHSLWLSQCGVSSTSFRSIPGLQLCPLATGDVRNKIPSLLTGISSDESCVLCVWEEINPSVCAQLKFRWFSSPCFPYHKYSTISTDLPFTRYARHINFWYLCTCLDLCHVVLKSTWDASCRTLSAKNTWLSFTCSVLLVSRQVWGNECGPEIFRSYFVVADNDDGGRKQTQKLQLNL